MSNRQTFFRLLRVLTIPAVAVLIMSFLPPTLNWTALMLIFAFGCYEIATTKLNDNA